MSEGAIREEIVRWGKSLFERGLTSGSSGNISVRTPDGYLAAPTNSCLEFLEPDRLAKLDAEGRHISGTCLRRNCLCILASIGRGRPLATLCTCIQPMRRRCHVVCGLVAEGHDENQLFRISVPTRDQSPGDLALSPVHPQLSRRRGLARGARNCNFVRNSPTLGESFRVDHCSGIAQAPSQAARGLAS
jgi:hypothetical protein